MLASRSQLQAICVAATVTVFMALYMLPDFRISTFGRGRA